MSFTSKIFAPALYFFFLFRLLYLQEEISKKKLPCLPPEDGLLRFKEGLLTLGSSSFQAFLPSREESGMLWNSSPITVAGAASVSHGLPFALNLKLNCQR
jgi:hypothetical protein